MNNVDDMLAYLCQDVNNKNEELEKRAKETDLALMQEDSLKPSIYSKHRNLNNQENAKINKVYTAMKGRAELSNLTDTFRSIPSEEIGSKTERSLASVNSRFTRYSTILQA